MAHQPIDYVAIDLDGVFFLPLGSGDMAMLAQAIGVQEAHLRETMVERASRTGLYDLFRTGELPAKEYWEWFFGELGISAEASETFLRALSSLRLPNPEVGELVERLRSRGTRVAVFSNNYADNIESLERRFGLHGQVDALVLSFEVGTLKPSPEFFRRAADRLGIEPSRVVLVDDSLANVDGATRAGMGAVLFQGVGALERELARRGLVEVAGGGDRGRIDG